MRIEFGIVVMLNILVNGLLLLGANRLCGYRPNLGRCLVASLAGGAYAAGCLVPGFSFLGKTLWRLIILSVQGMLAFDISPGALRRTLVFILLSMALGGFAGQMDGAGYGKVLVAAAAVWVLSMAGFRGGLQRSCVPVRLNCRGKTLEVMALRDTGNTLRDPVSGEAVLILGAEAAKNLAGLDKAMLADPIDTLARGKFPGLRLIPYRTVGQGSGMLLALRMDSVEIDGRPAGTLVAFAPEGLDQEGTFQALAGGMA